MSNILLEAIVIWAILRQRYPWEASGEVNKNDENELLI
jgi:hypothetical protein